MLNKLDSAFLISNLGLQLAQQHNAKTIEIECLTAMALAFNKVGANQEALAICFKMLKLSEEINDQLLLGDIYSLTSSFYTDLEE